MDEMMKPPVGEIKDFSIYAERFRADAALIKTLEAQIEALKISIAPQKNTSPEVAERVKGEISLLMKELWKVNEHAKVNLEDHKKYTIGLREVDPEDIHQA